jgi:hypothetical protein
METAKVDIRKLQTLNDCINRTIEALNQVRLSVHGAGLSHSGYGVQGLAGVPGYLGFQPQFASPFASPFGIAQQVAPHIAAQMFGINPNMTGIGHTAAAAAFNPYFAQNAFAQNALAQNALNWTQNALAQNALNAVGGVPGTFPYWNQNGLNHTANVAAQVAQAQAQAAQVAQAQQVSQDFADPYVSTRIAQTFPFVTWGYSPFNWNV